MAIKRKFPPRVATVYCSGGCRAKRGEDGALLCAYGCIGCGACVNTCRFDAIHLVQFHAVIDAERCLSCGACALVCPRGIIHLRLLDDRIQPLCSNLDKGFDAATKTDARTVCDVSCIACGLCVKNCPADAIRLVQFHAVIDAERCLSCGACAVVCPRHVIKDRFGVLTPVH